MVEGVNEGVVVNGRNKEQIATQDFRDADLIVALIQSDSEVPQGEKLAHFKAWAIYGNNLIETSFDEDSIQTTRTQPKLVWAHRKPYILSGDRVTV